MGEAFTLHLHCWVPPSKNCLKLNVDVGFKDGSIALATLAWDEVGRVQDYGLKGDLLILFLRLRLGYFYCIIAKDKPYLKIIIESDYKLVVDAILGFSLCHWTILAIFEDIKLFLKDYPHVSII